MPRDLFGTIASRPPSVRSQRAPVVSLVIHTVAIAGAILVSLAGTDALPVPREVLAFHEPIRMADLPPAPPSPAPRPVPTSSTPMVTSDAAPPFAPEGIKPESPFEDAHGIERQIGVITGDGDLTGILVGARSLEDPPPPPPAPPPAVPVRLHAGIRAPQKITNIAPAYPAIAQSVHVEGVVIIETTIDVHGNVVLATVLRSVPLLDAAALDAVRQWKYTPALLNGVPVPVIMTVTVNFRLR